MDLSWFIESLMAPLDHNSSDLREDSTGGIIASNYRRIGYESEPREKSADHLQPALHIPEPLSITWGVRPMIKEVIACDTIEN